MSTPPRRLTGLALALLLAALSGGCEQVMQDMYEQPRYDPLEPSALFPNGLSSRTPPPGTMGLRTGRLAESSGGRRGDPIPVQDDAGAVVPILDGTGSGSANAIPVPKGVPLELTRELYRRGQQRYEIFCAPCHGLVGDGAGLVVQRGFPSPPTYHSERLRNAPDQHFYNVITHGYGIMYAYNDRVPPADRWAIVAYIRALQTSQHAPVKLLSQKDLRRLSRPAEGNDG